MICESHLLSRGFLSSLLRPPIEPTSSRLFAHLASLQQHLHLPGYSKHTSSSSRLLSKMKSEACQQLRAHPSPAFHQNPLKNLLPFSHKHIRSPRSSCLFELAMVQHPRSPQKIAAKCAVDQKVVLPKALISQGTSLLHSSTIAENPSLEQTKKALSGAVVGSEKRTKQPLLTVAVDIDEGQEAFHYQYKSYARYLHMYNEIYAHHVYKIFHCRSISTCTHVHTFVLLRHKNQATSASSQGV